MACAIDSPYKNPEQEADTSNAPTGLHPNPRWTKQAVEGNAISGEVVERMMASTDEAAQSGLHPIEKTRGQFPVRGLQYSCDDDVMPVICPTCQVRVWATVTQARTQFSTRHVRETYSSPS